MATRSKIGSRLFGMLVVLAAVCVPVHNAQATLVLQLERISDTEAVLTGTGTVGVGGGTGNPHILGLANVFAVQPPSNTTIFAGSTLTMGGHLLDFAYDVADWFDVFHNGQSGLYIGRSGFQAIPDNSSISGAMHLLLTDGSAFADIGTSGVVTWGLYPGDPSGTWTIVASSSVPEPGTLSLLALVLVGAGLARKRAKG